MGPTELEEFDYWLNNFLYMRAIVFTEVCFFVMRFILPYECILPVRLVGIQRRHRIGSGCTCVSTATLVYRTCSAGSHSAGEDLSDCILRFQFSSSCVGRLRTRRQ